MTTSLEGIAKHNEWAHTAYVNVRLDYTAVLKLNGPAPGSILTLPDRTTAGQLLDLLHVPKAHQSHVAIFVNDQRARPTHVLADGDRVHLAVPMSGG